MRIVKTTANHQDERGEIRDILTHQSVDAVTYITCRAGSVRANHYHKFSVQYTYVLRGGFDAYSQQGEDGTTRESHRVTVGDLVIHEAGEAHAFRALEDGEILSLTMGPRNGEDYEKDTYRLKEKMVE
ncbi:MAG: cupin 2 conserved barrel domain protein [Candidatus Magasanikbacteria bacterium]|nr:cupin 2 conserved barrel domain protein [Candidatus Magasanikbacteria bacterium]